MVAGKPDQKRVQHCSAVEDARAEVALEQPAEVAQVLDVKWLIEPLGGVDLRDELRRRVLAEDRFCRASGQESQE